MVAFSRIFLTLLVIAGAGAAQGGPRFRRVSLLTLSVEGYPPYRDRRSYFDVGVEQMPQGRCELLDPRPSSQAARQPWAPLDFYSNVLGGTEQADRLGESDLFFAGDENNRNGGGASSRWTMAVTPYLLDSLEFTDRRRERDWASTHLTLVRGGLRYDGLIGVRAVKEDDTCGARAYLCTNVQPGWNCAADGWTQTLHQVIAIVDTWGGAGDKFRRIRRDRDRNDLAGLDAVVTDGAGTRRISLEHK